MPRAETIEIVEGRTFIPYSNVRHLNFPENIPDDEVSANLSRAGDSLVRTVLRYRQSIGHLCVLPVMPDDVASYDTPLGAVYLARTETYLKGQRRILKVLEAPLTFAIAMNVRNLRDHDDLANLFMMIRLGKTVYPLRCIQPLDDSEKERQAIEKHFSSRRGTLTSSSFLGRDLFDDKYNQKALIPGHPTSLKQVSIEFQRQTS